MKRITGISAITLVFILALSFIGCDEKKANPEEEVTPPIPAKLEILSHRQSTRAELGVEGEGSEWIIIVGTAKNVSSDTLSQAEVKVSFLDEKGELVLAIGSLTTVKSFNIKTRNLAVGEIWEFVIKSAQIPARSVHHYEIEVGICF